MLPVRLFLALGGALVCLTLASCGDDDSGTEDPATSESAPGLAGHQRMLDELRAIPNSMASSKFFGDAEIKKLAAQLEGDPAPLPRLTLLKKLGTLEVRHGDIEGGIAHLEEAYSLFKEIGSQMDADASLDILFKAALGYLRLAETQNCVHCRTSESCLLPITAEGVHEKPEAARRAIVLLKEALTHHRGNAICVWLLNIAAMTVGEYPEGVPPTARIPAAVFEAQAPFPRFPNVAAALGLDSINLSGGVVVDDIDGDELIDIMCSTWDVSESPQLFLNNGDGTFREVSKQWGLEGLFGGLNMNHADYDNDGDVDVLILRGAWLGADGRQPNSLLRNMGDRFVDVTFDSGLGENHYPTQTAAWADYNLDGHLDLYIGNEASPDASFPSQLFHNNGDGTFTNVASRAGVSNGGFTKGTNWGDYDADGYPDLYVSNMGGANRLYRNRGDGTFVDVAGNLGVDGPQMSFPAWFFDYDNDGNLDIFVATYVPDVGAAVLSYSQNRNVAELPRLYRGLGSGSFADVAHDLGLRRLAITMGSNYGDLDNDGYPDIYLGTGYPGLEGLVPNVMLWNRAGNKFLDVSASGGFSHLQKGHAVAFADLDSDGDQDVFEQLGGAYPVDAFSNVLFENPGFGNHWLIVKLVGTSCNRGAVGAHVVATFEEDGEMRSVHQWVNTGGSFGSAPLRRHIGLGSATVVKRLTITWPGSSEPQVLEGVEADQFIRVTQDQEGFEKIPYRATPFKR